MDEDDLTNADIRATILRGRLFKTYTDDPRGPRFVVRGLAGTRPDELEVVCRFLPSGRMRIIARTGWTNEGEEIGLLRVLRRAID